MTHHVVAALLDLAGDQHGLVHASQLGALGIDRSALSRLTRAGVLERIGGPGIRRVAVGTPSPHELLLSSVWAAGPAAVASHRGAAWLWQLDGFSKPVLEVTTSRRGTRRPHNVVLHHSTDLRPGLVTTVDGIPVTEPTLTLVDLAGVVDADTLETAFDSALRQGLTSLARAEAILRRLARRGRNGIGRFRELVEGRIDQDGVPESVFETRLRLVLRRAGLPEPVAQVTLHDQAGFIGRFDCAYPPGPCCHRGRQREASPVESAVRG